MVSVTVEGPRLGTFALGRSLFNRICILTRSPTPAELGAADTTGSVVVGPVRNDAIPKSQKLRLCFTVGNWNVCVNSATAGYGSLGANRLDWSFHTLEGHSDRDNISHLFRCLQMGWGWSVVPKDILTSPIPQGTRKTARRSVGGCPGCCTAVGWQWHWQRLRQVYDLPLVRVGRLSTEWPGCFERRRSRASG